MASYELLIPADQKLLCQAAIDRAEALLKKKLGDAADKILEPLTIKIGDNLTESGGQAFAEKNLIIFDAAKNKLSLQAAEDLLVGYEVLKKGDWALMLDDNDTPWSCLTYQLIHELGHIIDGQVDDGKQYKRVQITDSPTLYGQTGQHEAFAELFTYWVLGVKTSQKFSKMFDELIKKNWRKI